MGPHLPEVLSLLEPEFSRWGLRICISKKFPLSNEMVPGADVQRLQKHVTSKNTLCTTVDLVGIIQSVAFVIGFRVSEFVHEPFKSEVSVSCNSPALWN